MQTSPALKMEPPRLRTTGSAKRPGRRTPTLLASHLVPASSTVTTVEDAVVEASKVEEDIAVDIKARDLLTRTTGMDKKVDTVETIAATTVVAKEAATVAAKEADTVVETRWASATTITAEVTSMVAVRCTTRTTITKVATATTKTRGAMDTLITTSSISNLTSVEMIIIMATITTEESPVKGTMPLPVVESTWAVTLQNLSRTETCGLK